MNAIQKKENRGIEPRSLDKKHPQYDAWLTFIISSRCNLNCKYCFHHALEVKKRVKSLFGIKDTSSIRTIKTRSNTSGIPEKIDIPSLIETLDATHKIFKIAFAGAGEPFLAPNIIEACGAISKKHYLTINTNLATGNVVEFANKINPEKVIQVHASLHIKELERLNLLERYISNFILCKEKGFNIDAVEVAYPPLLKEAEKYRKYFKDKGIKLQFSLFVGWYRGKRYPLAYTKKELEAFGVRREKSGFYQKGQFCNAGYNTGIILAEGRIQVCGQVKKNIGNVYSKIEFRSKLIKCPYKHCGCPFKIFDPYLFNKALAECKIETE